MARSPNVLRQRKSEAIPRLGAAPDPQSRPGRGRPVCARERVPAPRAKPLSPTASARESYLTTTYCVLADQARPVQHNRDWTCLSGTSSVADEEAIPGARNFVVKRSLHAETLFRRPQFEVPWY